VAEPVPGPTHVTVAATGDLLIHVGVARQALANGGGRRYNFGPMFTAIRRRIAGADLALCHVETPLVPGPVQGYPSFRTPPALARAVRRAGWDACSTASNHSLDAGQHGIDTTLRALGRVCLRHAGTARSRRERRRTTILDVRGVKLALLSYSAVSNGQRVPHPWSVSWAEPGAILADARRARRRGADAAIVNLHWGEEYRHATTRSQRALADRLTRSPDVAAIVGQHAHVVQPIRFVNGTPVVFGEGNLISNQRTPPATRDGLVALIDLVRRGRRVTARRVRYVPTFVSRPDYRVLVAPRGSASWSRTVAAAGRGPRVRPVGGSRGSRSKAGP
jgi:poly-gamma-glutamate capsule biosynthesis protein CapA/YwtB (metallophosphatase superfamily)